MTRTLKSLLVLGTLAGPAAAQAPIPSAAGRWKIDPAHSTVAFAVRHMGLATVRGSFTEFEGVVETDASGREIQRFEATIRTASVTTGIDRRDTHLRSADFLDVANHPVMRFVSTRVSPAGGGKFAVDGELTIRGITRPVSLVLETEGQVVKDPWGNQRRAGVATGAINRKEWGLTWNQALELGGVLVGDEVKLTLEVEAVAEAVAAATAGQGGN